MIVKKLWEWTCPWSALPELRFATNKQEKRKVDREENKQTNKQTNKQWRFLIKHIAANLSGIIEEHVRGHLDLGDERYVSFDSKKNSSTHFASLSFPIRVNPLLPHPFWIHVQPGHYYDFWSRILRVLLTLSTKMTEAERWKVSWTALFHDFPTCPTFSRTCIFFWLFLFSDLLSSALLFSDSSHLCFSICPYCRKFDF